MTTPFILALGFVPVAGFIAWTLFRSYLAAKAKSYEEKKRQAQIALACLNYLRPSWHGEDDRSEEFFAVVKRVAAHKGVPTEYLHAVFEKKVNMRRLTWYVGNLENHGASWAEQQMAVVDQVVEWWESEKRL